MKTDYVIIVNWNGWGDTIECLESVMRLKGDKFCVVVCDNNSNDNSLGQIRSWARGSLDSYVPTSNLLHSFSFPPIPKPLHWVEYDREAAENGGASTIDPSLVLIRISENLGFAGGINVALRYALARDNFQYVWILNNDTVVEPEALTALMARMEASPSIGICGSTLLRYGSPTRIQARGGGYYCKWIGLPWHLGQLGHDNGMVDEKRVEHRMNYVVGASMLVSRNFLHEVGLLGEDYFLFFEETDWVQRARGRYNLAYAKNSRVYHKVGRSAGTSTNPRKKSLICDYYSIRNRLLFTKRYFREALPTVYLSLIAALLIRLLIGRWDHAVMIWRILLGETTVLARQR